ncbi:DUF1120 domain-containing protein [Herbaspirillum sp. RV1423]|uniref:DUF1120 domain-containing protein n=1 Tax=Herbaspirillum sp. RV1423 TaxID=1443993 RepID=UPI0004ADF55B|nr:DUF1120 domain-containing protein [Herbaspirillum sp. RV1423]
MNKQVAQLSALAASLLVSFAAHAADTAELKVKGVIRPSACTPSFTGTNVVDYGTISAAKDLNPSSATVLSEKTVPLTITCDADTKVAVHAIDNRATSVVAGIAANIGAGVTDAQAFGLGTVAGTRIGAYALRLIPGSVNATAASGTASTPDVLADATNSNAWIKSAAGRFNADGTARQSFTTAGTSTPVGYKTITGSIGVQAVIDKSANLPLTQSIDLDGLATIEVQYL